MIGWVFDHQSPIINPEAEGTSHIKVGRWHGPASGGFVGAT
ncbi:MAG: hypothetical protein ACM335_11620 [Deltaproteobacteria bacterium]